MDMHTSQNTRKQMITSGSSITLALDEWMQKYLTKPITCPEDVSEIVLLFEKSVANNVVKV